MTITLTVTDRIATISTDEKIVAGNTYPVTLSLDSEWTGTYYVRVRFGSLYYDIPASGSSVNVQIPVGYPEVGLGIYSENIGICTNEVRVKVLRSILEQGVSVVEFDTDLYTQWQNEVSELVCDSDFDAESERPVKNSVLTAWKDTVPLDSALVHIAGAETITGEKTLTGKPTVKASVVAYLDIVTSRGYQVDGYKSEIRFYDQKDGADSPIDRIIIGTYPNGGYNYINSRLYTFDRSTSFAIEQRVFSDHCMLVMPTYYPVYSGGNPQPLIADAIETSGNIAVDPRLVHTTGLETIAGAKTFTSLLTASNVQVKDASTPTVTMLKGSTEVANIASDGTQAGLTASSQFFGLRGLGTAPFGQSPSYTADQSADAKIVTRAMLATTPTVVHTTGLETIAGAKTFANTVTFSSTQSYNNLYIKSHGWYNRITSRKYTADESGYDDHFEIGTVYANASTAPVYLRASAPRTTLGDTSETQASISLFIIPNKDNTGTVRLEFKKTNGEIYTKTLATFNGTSWS